MNSVPLKHVASIAQRLRGLITGLITVSRSICAISIDAAAVSSQDESMLSLKPVAKGCFALDSAHAPPGIEGETYSGSSWNRGRPPRLQQGEILIETADFHEVVFKTGDAAAVFYGVDNDRSPSIPKCAVLHAGEVVPLLPREADDRLWVDRKFLPAIAALGLGSVRLNNLYWVDQGAWFKPDRPMSETEVKLVGYHIVSDNVALDPIDRAVPVHDLPASGVVFQAQHFGELGRWGVEGLQAVALTDAGLRLAKFKVTHAAVAGTVLSWLTDVGPGTIIHCDWPFRHERRVGVSVGDLAMLEGNLGECIFYSNTLWIRTENLRLRTGGTPVALQNHPSIRRQCLLVTPESREANFISQSRAQKAHVIRGIKRYHLVENGSLVTQPHYKRVAVEAAPLKDDVAERKAKLISKYPDLNLPADWDRYSDKAYADHFRVLELVRKEGWSWKPLEKIFDYEADANFFRWMEQKGLSFTSPITGKTCCRYSSPCEAIRMHEPVELIKAIYPQSYAFIFHCACLPGFPAKAMLSAITS